jgi:hypothetical protein
MFWVLYRKRIRQRIRVLLFNIRTFCVRDCLKRYICVCVVLDISLHNVTFR